MTLTHEDLQAIAQLIKTEINPVKKDIQSLKGDVQTLKDDVRTLKEQYASLDKRLTKVELTLENEISHNIQLLAENHGNLIDKMNAATKYSDKLLIHEVQMSSISARIEQLEDDMSMLKSKIA